MTSTSSQGRIAKTVLDDKGRVASIQPPGGINPIVFHYDTLGRNDSITQGTRVTSFTFDSNGYVKSITDPAGRTTSIANDAVGRPLLSTQPDASGIGVSYDANGNVASVTPPGRPADLFSYDAADEETQYSPPNVGAPMSTVTSYNLDRQVTLVSRPDGDTIVPQYDSVSGRLQSISTAVGTTSFGYKTTTGQLQSIAAPGETLTYGYDGSLLTSVAWSGSVSGSLTRTYDTSFRVASETVAGTTITYTYDNDDLLTQAGDLHIPRDPATGYVGSGTTLGTLQEGSTYDAYGALQTYTVNSCPTTPCTAIYSVDYGTRDAVGRIVHKTETVQGLTHTYDDGYDSNGRLSDVFKDGVAAGSVAWSSTATYAAAAMVTAGGVEYTSLQAGNANHAPPNVAWWQIAHAYTYDANGNRLFAPNLIGKAAPVYDAQDRMLSYGDCSYSYKNDGSLRSKTCPDGVTTYDYDEFGNLRHVGMPNGNAIDYTIDGQNRRVGKKVNGVLVEGWLYRNGLQPVAWLDGTGAVKAQFIYAGGSGPAYMVTGGKTYHFVKDHLGSVREVVDSIAGAVLESIDYDEFGNVLTDTGTVAVTPFGFASGLYDRDTGLVRFGARDYDAATGRWTAKDPSGLEGGINIYEYAANDPINNMDFDGEDWRDWELQPYADFFAGYGDIMTGIPFTSMSVTGLIRKLDGTDNVVNQCSNAYLGGMITGVVYQTVLNEEGFRRGHEFKFSVGERKFRLAPWGNRTDNPYGQAPHYHRNIPDPANPGASIPGGGIGRHRPWEPGVGGRF
jgi:RHS repeat-associated protein